MKDTHLFGSSVRTREFIGLRFLVSGRIGNGCSLLVTVALRVSILFFKSSSVDAAKINKESLSICDKKVCKIKTCNKEMQ